MDANTKYKRWGWGAIAGLIGVILIAGLIVAVTMSSPKPNAELASNDTNSSVSGEIEAGENGSNSENGSNDNNGSSDAQSEEEKKAAEKKAAEEKAAQEKAEAEAKAKEDAKKKEAASSTDKTGDASDKVATSDTKKMPKTGPADNLMAIVAFAVIAGLATYNISLKKQA